MKDSGIPWVGEVPEEWGVDPLRQYFTERRHKNANGIEGNLLSLSYGRIIRKDIESSDGLLPANFLGYNIVEPGDIVFRMTDLQNDKRSLRSGIVEERGIITSAYIAAAPKHGVESRFHNYLQRAYDQLKVYYNMGGGVRQGINYDDLKRMPVLTPPIDEQQRIADYLDERCREIDAVKQALSDEVEALQRLRKATIHKAVTKGLDENAPMKDSGVEWIGELPDHWQVTSLKSLGELRTGKTPPSENMEMFDGDCLWYTPGDFDNEILGQSERTVSEEAIRKGVVPTYPMNSILIVVIGGTAGKVGFCPRDCSSNQQITAVIPRSNAFAKYLFYELLVVGKELKAMACFTTLPILNNAFLGSLKLVCPDVLEQQRIADYLDERCAAIDSVIETRTKQLARLEDYRKALVFAYVTGKKEVPVT